MMISFFSQPKVRLALISIFLALFLSYFFLIPHNNGAFRAIPSQTTLLMEFNGLVKAGNQVQQVADETWKAVLNTTLFQNSWSEIAAVERLCHHDAVVQASFARNTLLAAYSLHQADSISALFILELNEAIPLENLLKTNPLTKKIFPYQFHSQTLFTVHLSQTERMVVAQKGRLLIFSRYSYLVEDALTQLENARGWWADNRYLDDLNPEAGLRVFFRPAKWEAQQAGKLLPDARPIAKTISDNIAWIGISWDGVKATALCQPEGFLAGLGSWNGSIRKEIYAFLPDNTAAIAWAGFDNQSLFFKQLAGKLPGDFERFILPWIGNEAALVVTEPLSESLSDDRLLLLSVRDSTKAQKALESYGENRGLLAHVQFGMFDIFGFQSQSLLAPFFEGTDAAFQNPYFAHLGKYIVVAPNRASLEIFIEKYIANQTLAQNVDFLQLVQQLEHDGRGLLVLNGGYLPRIIRLLFQDKTSPKPWETDVQVVSKIGWLAAELTPAFGRKIKVTFSSQKQTTLPPKSNVFWKTVLGAPATSSAFTIPQPGMAIGTAILIQDKQSQLYCLKPDGSILWQKPIGDQILSSITPLDFYQNGRNCYLFNTRSQVWIVDENGKEVQGYPLALKAPACNGLTVADFDKNQAFNYFVNCTNGNAYGFDQYGRALDGWNPQSNTGIAAGEILHFQHQGKDFLAILGKQGLLSVFGRDGKHRFLPVQLPGNFNSPAMVDKSTGKPRIVCISQEGKFFSCDLDGKYAESNLALKAGSAPLLVSALKIEEKPAFALLQGKQLQVFRFASGSGQKIFSKQFNQEQQAIFPIESGLGLCSGEQGKITLLDKSGNLVPGFPLPGSSPFGICSLGQQKLLITGNGSAVFSYKLEN